MAFTAPKADQKAALNEPALKEAQLEGTTTEEIILGSPPGRMFRGTGLPGVAEIVGGVAGYGPEAARIRGQYEKETDKGRRWWSERTHGILSPPEAPDWFGLAGAVAGTKGVGLPAVTGKEALKQGAKIGGYFGATAPTGEVETQGEWLKRKAIQAALGTTFGAGIPLAVQGGVGAINLGRNIFGKTTEVAKRLLSKYQQRIIGEPHLDAVKAATRNVQELVQGSKPTVAEGLVGTAEGSPIAAHQHQIAQAKGGPSALFGQRWDEKDMARRAAEGFLTPMRNLLVQEANDAGGIPTGKIMAGLYDLANERGVRVNKPLFEALEKIREQVMERGWSTAGTGPGAKRMYMDAKDVYQLREQLARTREQAGDAAVSRVYERGIKVLDDAMGRVAPSWSRYLHLQEQQSARIAADLSRQRQMYQPSQVTRLTRDTVPEEEIERLPGLMDWHFSVGNYLLGLVRGKLEPEIERQAALQYLNPREFQKSLNRHPDIFIPDVWRQLFVPAEVLAGEASGGLLTKKAKAAARAVGATELPSPIPPTPPPPQSPPTRPTPPPPAAPPASSEPPYIPPGVPAPAKPPAATAITAPAPPSDKPANAPRLGATEAGKAFKQAMSALMGPWPAPVDWEALKASPAGQELQRSIEYMFGGRPAPASSPASSPAAPAKPVPSIQQAPPAPPPRISAPPMERLKSIQSALNTEQKRTILRLAQRAQSADPQQQRAAKDELRAYLVKSLRPAYPDNDPESLRQLIEDSTDFTEQLMSTNFPNWATR